MTKSVTYTIYTDGGCKGNPGVGAWAFYVLECGLGRSGNDAYTTNNKMELSAAIEAIQWAVSEQVKKICIVTDSQYLQKGILEWIHSWKKNNWKTAAKKEVKNKELWLELDSLLPDIDVEWNWVRGHAGDAHNELVHDLVQKSISELI